MSKIAIEFIKSGTTGASTSDSLPMIVLYALASIILLIAFAVVAYKILKKHNSISSLKIFHPYTHVNNNSHIKSKTEYLSTKEK